MHENEIMGARGVLLHALANSTFHMGCMDTV
jgi:hypothetical protein